VAHFPGRYTLGAGAVAGVLLTAVLAARAPQSAAPALDPQQPIPFDTAVRRGTLPNGITYFVRQNARPEKRVALRLAVKAGSLYEADDQQGLAHLIEHMAFNGSAHFKPGELVSYFESTGARLGPHVNAYTSFDETVYMLDLPTESKEIVARGLTALADFAGGLTLDPEEIDRERGVVIEEWRGRLGAGSRIRDQQLPVIYEQSRYAERIPIGKPEVLRTAPAARLRAFYDTWYQPNRIAIVVVGDIDASEIETGVRTAFGPLISRAPAVAPPDAKVPLIDGTRVNVAADPELTSSSIQWLRKRPKEGNSRVGDYRRTLVERLFTSMFNDRFGELARKPDAKFLSAGGGSDALSPTVSSFRLSARVADGGLTGGLTALQIEARRVLQHGFAASELDRAKRSLAAAYERAYNERDKNEHASFAREYVSYFLSGEPSPGIEYEYRLVRWALPAITLADVNALAKDRLSGEAQVILATAPLKDNARLPNEADIQRALDEGAAVAVVPWNDGASNRAIIDTLPTPGQVVARRQIADLGVTVATFSNGTEAWLKPTDFKNDQILFMLYAPGGASNASCDENLQIRFTTDYVGLSGLGRLSAVDLEKALAGTLAGAAPFIAMSTHGIQGSSAPADLETAMQLLHQTFKAPGDDPEAFALLKRQIEASVANRGRSPSQVFGEKYSEVNTSGHCSARPFTAEQLPLLDRVRMMASYKERFANAADFTLFMVGAFNIDQALPLLARYVGGLPSTGRKSATVKDAGIRFPTGVQRVSVKKGKEPRSQTVISFYADPSPDPMEQERVIAATAILQTVLRDSLREDLGQTYTVSVGLQQSLPQRGDGAIVVSFGAAPENIDAMADRVLREVKRLQEDGPPADLVANAKEGARRDYATALKQNMYWMRRLQTVHLLGGNPSDVPTRARRIDAVTVDAVRDTFRAFFPLDRYTVVTLRPEDRD
jgi:zinc protease